MFPMMLRAILLYIYVFIVLKALGKRQVGQLQPIELVIVIIISELASLYMQNDNIPILNSLIPIIVLTVLQIIVTLINLKSEKCRDFICGKPSILIQQGVVQEKELRRQRMTINDLTEQLRGQGYFNIEEVDYCYMETDGNISVLLKSNKRPPTTEELHLKPPAESPTTLLILDGRITQCALQSIEKTELWLKQKLQQYNIENPKQVFLAGLGSDGQFFFQFKENRGRKG